MTTKYGDRETYTPEDRSRIQRPDGTWFKVNRPSTYRITTVPMVPPPVTRGNRMEGVDRNMRESGSLRNTINDIVASSMDPDHRVVEVDRQVSETGRSWLITVRRADGREAIISRVRSSREGRGGPWQACPDYLQWPR